MSADRRGLFGNDPTSYEAGRPGYPDRVFELLAERGGLGPGARVLEIGPGTGQATRNLVDAGASVTAVELSPALADRVRRRHPTGVEVVVGAFEEVHLGELERLATDDFAGLVERPYLTPIYLATRR